MGKKRCYRKESAILNYASYIQYLDRLTELAISVFEWQNIPDTIDPRFLELTLFTSGQAVFFKDEVIGFLGLQTVTGGNFNVYRIPNDRRAYAVNGYQRELNQNNSVIIYNSLLRKPSLVNIKLYAKRLSNIDRIIDINVNAQKTPTLVQCNEQQKLTMETLFEDYDGNVPIIYANKGLDTKDIKPLTSQTPYIADKLYELKTQIWNEALTFLGITNINTTKKERLITDEVSRNQGGVIASRNSRLESRQLACKAINKIFGLNVWCDYKKDYAVIDDIENEDGENDE